MLPGHQPSAGARSLADASSISRTLSVKYSCEAALNALFASFSKGIQRKTPEDCRGASSSSSTLVTRLSITAVSSCCGSRLTLAPYLVTRCKQIGKGFFFGFVLVRKQLLGFHIVHKAR